MAVGRKLTVLGPPFQCGQGPPRLTHVWRRSKKEKEKKKKTTSIDRRPGGYPWIRYRASQAPRPSCRAAGSFPTPWDIRRRISLNPSTPVLVGKWEEDRLSLLFRAGHAMVTA